jgi:hypothetical protein
MATYSTRFSNILSSSQLTTSDRTFVESLRNQHSRKRTLSSRQAAAFGRVEERYAKLKLSGKPLVDPALTSRLEAILKDSDSDSWDNGFASSVLSQVKAGRTLSPKQLALVDDIEKRYNPEAKAARSDWLSNYGPEHREIAKVCAEYYSNTPYYQDLVRKILANPDTFVLTQKQYNSMCQNKYALKVIKNHEAKPKYDLQSVVELRKTSDKYKNNYPFNRKGKPGFIIKTGHIAPESCAGGLYYSVLFAGEVQPVDVQERDIKLMKKAKV